MCQQEALTVHFGNTSVRASQPGWLDNGQSLTLLMATFTKINISGTTH